MKKQSFDEKQAAKKAAVMGAGKKKRKLLPIILIPVFAVLVAVVGFNLIMKVWKGPQAVALAKEVTHPVNLFEDGRARHFQIDIGNGLTVRYFVLKSSDGVLRAAFDACDVCWKAGKGYYQEGDNMVCRNCGKRFASVKVNEIKGGCNPAPLTRQVVGENLVIQIKDIIEGQQYFNFGARG
ncbi:Fe-S-containing protein [Thermodesulfobacteriota bacterium]